LTFPRQFVTFWRLECCNYPTPCNRIFTDSN